MLSLLTLIGVSAWGASGVAGFQFWWQRDHGTPGPVDSGLIAGCLLGPVAWIVGGVMHGGHR